MVCNEQRTISEYGRTGSALDEGRYWSMGGQEAEDEHRSALTSSCRRAGAASRAARAVSAAATPCFSAASTLLPAERASIAAARAAVAAVRRLLPAFSAAY